MEIDLVILNTIIFTSIIQSLVGVGILLFGTPILLLFGFHYFEVLNVLLPISIIINFFQFNRNLGSLDRKLVWRLVILILPIIGISLSIATYINVNFTKLIALFLILISLYRSLKIPIESVVNTTPYLIVMAIIHGLTNLGGSLLTAYAFTKNWNKLKTRTNIALCYFAFAITQLITLWINNQININKGIIVYIPLAVLIYIFTNKYVFIKIDEGKFAKIISILLFVFGIILLVQV